MCGIFAIFSKSGGHCYQNGCTNGKKVKTVSCPESLREMAYRHSCRQRHRGPDYTGVYEMKDDGVIMIHERLNVVCVRSGRQPLLNEDQSIMMVANGEIYNYQDLSKHLAKVRGGYTPRVDCDVILALYEEYGLDLFKWITGMFAFALYDSRTQEILIARDPIGINPMYTGKDEHGNVWVASEMKCLVGKCVTVETFTPGTYQFGKLGQMKTHQYYQPQWMKEIPTERADLTTLREKLEDAVRTHLHCDKRTPFGALLSGGVDSSLIASIAMKIMRETQPNFRLKTYSVGLKGAPDFKYSKMVADYIDSDHTEVNFTIQEGLDCIRNIIYNIETYDVTTIRASTPMYILARYIKSEGLKMVLSGEGADEILGGYLYFHKCPTLDEFHLETVSRMKGLHLSDCLRANKSTMSWGIELRVPFLDTAFVDYAMGTAPGDRIPGSKNQFLLHDKGSAFVNGIEKYILRAAFAKEYLPDEVLWRQKEQFSDGVGYDWIDTIREYSASHVTDEEFESASKLYPINTPATKEAFYYRKLFAEMFPGDEYAKTVSKWVPRTDWGCSADPSGRAQAVHTAHK